MTPTDDYTPPGRLSLLCKAERILNIDDAAQQHLHAMCPGHVFQAWDGAEFDCECHQHPGGPHPGLSCEEAEKRDWSGQQPERPYTKP